MTDVIPRMVGDLGGEALRRRFAHLLDEPTPPRLVRAARYGLATGRRRFWRRAAFLATGCLVLAGGGWLVLAKPTGMSAAPAVAEATAPAVAEALEPPVPDLVALGYSLSAAEQDGTTSLRAVYDRIAGGSVVLARAPAERSPRVGDGFPRFAAGAVWHDGNFAYSLIAHGHAVAELDAVAAEMQRQIRAPSSSISGAAETVEEEALTAFASDVGGIEVSRPTGRDFAVPLVPPID